VIIGTFLIQSESDYVPLSSSSACAKVWETKVLVIGKPIWKWPKFDETTNLTSESQKMLVVGGFTI
jgi:hypothetical protein